MDRVEQLLREEWAQPPALQLDAAGLLAGAHRRRRATAARVGLAVLVVALVVGLGAQAVRTHRPVRPTAPSPTFSSAPLAWPLVLPGNAAFGVYAGAGGDTRHLYLIVAHCFPGVNRPCQAELAVTADGGVSWTRRPLPLLGQAELRYSSFLPILSAAPDTVVVGDEIYWVSTDAGGTFHPITVVPMHSVPGLPDGAVVLLTGSDTAELVLADGTRVWMPLRVPAEFNAFQLIRGQNGTIWQWDSAAGGPGHPDRGYVSHDLGRTWTEVSMPPPTADTPVLLAQHGRVAYRVDSSSSDSSGQGIAAIWRTVDTGRSWQSVPLPGRPAQVDPFDLTAGMFALTFEMPTDFGSTAVLPDGTLLLTRYGRLFRLAPDSHVFVPQPAPVVWVSQAGPQVVGVTVRPDGTDQFSLTADGRQWREIQLR